MSKISNVFIYNFEDFCLDYEKTLSKLISNSGLNENDHKLKNKFFNPKKSKKNIGQWKTVSKDLIPEIKLIEKYLYEYLVN